MGNIRQELEQLHEKHARIERGLFDLDFTMLHREEPVPTNPFAATEFIKRYDRMYEGVPSLTVRVSVPYIVQHDRSVTFEPDIVEFIRNHTVHLRLTGEADELLRYMIGCVGFTLCGSSCGGPKGVTFKDSRVDPPKEFQNGPASMVYGTLNNSVEGIIAGIRGLDRALTNYEEVKTNIDIMLIEYKHPTKPIQSP